MMKLEEYVEKRKKADGINEFDKNKKDENLKICVNYILEYFNNYLNITELEEITIAKEEKLDKYRKQLKEYDLEIKEWLVKIYAEYGNFLDKSIGRRIRNEQIYFYLLSEDSEFRSLSYECYAEYIKKFPYLKGQEEMLYKFLKEYHRVESNQSLWKNPIINEEIDKWVETTKNKYGVNLYRFASDWVNYFFDTPEIWGTKHRKKNNDAYKGYEYDYKNGDNLFNIDSLYRNMPKKPFTKGKKQEFETLLMYYWLNDIVGDDDNYWNEYLNKVSK